MSTRRNNVLVLALMKERELYDNFSQLYDSIRSVAVLSTVETKNEFERKLRVTKPSVVVAVDAGISMPENRDVLVKLTAFAREGGVVVCCCNFSNHLNYSQARQFFQFWGLPWDAGSYLRTTVHRNPEPDSVKGMLLDKLPLSYSIKSLYLTHVPANQAIYTPSSSSQIESRVFSSNLFPVDPAETPCAYGPVGRGYFGYIGDVNNEEGSTKVALAMSHLLQDAVLADALEQEFGLEFIPGGGVRKVSRVSHAKTPTIFTDVVRQAGGELEFGNRIGYVGENFQLFGTPANASPPPSSGNTPAASPSPLPKPTTRNPPRPREAEVTARGLKRAENSKRKMDEAELLKEQVRCWSISFRK
jgi:hypothetical protein